MSERILRAVPPESVYEVWQRNVDELLDLRLGGGGLIIVRGMPGSGVTALLRRFGAGAERRGAHVVSTALSEHERGIPCSGLDRLALALPCIRDLEALRDGDPDADAHLLARRFTAAMLPPSLPAEPRCLIIDDLADCDETTALVLACAHSSSSS